MNVLILSPQFPPNIEWFCHALRARGINVLGIGDAPASSLHERLRGSMTEYLHVPDMWEYPALRAAVEGLHGRHGPIDRIGSLGEHWLAHEGRLRDDFRIPGLSAAATQRQRSKSGMGELYRAAGIPFPPGIRVDSPDDLQAAVATFGLPLVLKPDTGSGAAATFAVRTPAALDVALARTLSGYLAQPFIEGDIVTYDGLTNADGEIVVSTSHVYDAGIMEVLTGRLDGHYYSLRETPPDVDTLGRRAVAAFDVRERFFHQEFFRRADGSLTALEMNLRPPGGFTTDMMNYACDFDVYALWAGVVHGERWRGFRYRRHYHTAHAGRRLDRHYAHTHDDVVSTLGDTLISFRQMPKVFSATMGDDVYLLRHPSIDALKAAIAMVHLPASRP